MGKTQVESQAFADLSNLMTGTCGGGSCHALESMTLAYSVKPRTWKSQLPT
ncbi:hypothetical protein MC7420_4939 [Coleofasciculus chthonoplastes PCC 7420]|uniref:Uncharacterized protein n=1 Tax=Coleofasciculus chthonoplastes PCC 7420 TaxID=118168 RepID=B4VZA6_9CYAN|nr:hypothetical protein MC7420_4939 [Coleofasciculus chthonoplastes PCC 7420]